MLAALVVPEGQWQAIERELQNIVEEYFPAPRPDNFEVHAADIRAGRSSFKGFSIDQRLAFREAWLKVAQRCNLKLIYRAIVKKRFQRWQQNTFGTGIQINPHVNGLPAGSSCG